MVLSLSGKEQGLYVVYMTENVKIIEALKIYLYFSLYKRRLDQQSGLVW
jgi:hypothetical protein